MIKYEVVSKSFGIAPIAIATALNGIAQVIMAILGIIATIISIIASYKTVKDKIKNEEYAEALKEIEKLKEKIKNDRI